MGTESLKQKSIFGKTCDPSHFCCLRLPDVIGPRDGTGRLWPLQLRILLALARDEPLPLTKEQQTRPLSLVYSKDVAQFVSLVINNGVRGVFHVAFDEICTLAEFATLVAKSLDPNATLAVATFDDEEICYLPSVTTRTGVLAIERARSVGFQPTCLSDAVAETTRFFVRAWTEHAAERPLEDFSHDEIAVLESAHRRLESHHSFQSNIAK